MTISGIDLDALRRENRADLATLREIPDLVALLRPTHTPDGESVPTVWQLETTTNSDLPSLTLGVRDRVGFLHWFETPEDLMVPAGTQYRDGGHDYVHGGHPSGCQEGEEIPVDVVYAAAREFVATGRRPTCLQWIPESEVPDVRAPFGEDSVFEAMRAAADRPSI